MLVSSSVPELDRFRMIDTINNNEKETFNLQASDPTTNDTSNSVSSIRIPLVRSQPILAVSPNYILVNEYKNKRKRWILIDYGPQGSTINVGIPNNVIDILWNNIEEKFFLLTEKKVFTFNPNGHILRQIDDIKSTDSIPFKCFTSWNDQYSLLIAYDEWASKFIDKWEKNNERDGWLLVKRHPLDLTNNEFIGAILYSSGDGGNSLNLIITVCNELIEQWRVEIRNAETFLCFRKVLLHGLNFKYDYKIVDIKNATNDIKWLIYSPSNTQITAVNSAWNFVQLKYRCPVYHIAKFQRKKLSHTNKKKY